jgi:hypothetical protein
MNDRARCGLSTIGQVAVPGQDLDLWLACFHDSAGNTHALMSEVPRR